VDRDSLILYDSVRKKTVFLALAPTARLMLTEEGFGAPGNRTPLKNWITLLFQQKLNSQLLSTYYVTFQKILFCDIT